jgi:hypothetical protein
MIDRPSNLLFGPLESRQAYFTGALEFLIALIESASGGGQPATSA